MTNQTQSAWRLPLLAAVLCAVILAGCSGPEAADEHAAHDQAGEAAAADWCAEHAIAESKCPFCNPGLLETGGWCAGHDIAEALCWQCDPDLVAAYQAVGDWCAGHGLPESRCLACNPGLAAAEPVADAAGIAAGPGIATDPGPRILRQPAVTCATQSLTVTFERPGIAAEAGLQFATVAVRPVTRTLECNAVVAYDGNRHAQLAPQVAGTVATVERDLGDRVTAGEVLATVISPAFGAAKAAYLQTQAEVAMWEKNHAREADLLTRGVATERDLLEAENRLAEARIALSRAQQELMGLGLTAAQVTEVGRRQDVTSSYRVTAPFDGVVVARNATLGEMCDSSRPLFAVADVSGMWALLDVYEADVREIAAGQTVVLHVEGLPGEPVAGTITRVSSQLDARTRTLQARAEIDNTAGLLRANMFARAVVAVRSGQQTVVVPRDAVQWEGCCNVVFVRTSETTFRPRKVRLGPAAGEFREVLSGLQGGEVVVTQGSFLLKTEILKGNIGAGCCEAQPGT